MLPRRLSSIFRLRFQNPVKCRRCSNNPKDIIKSCEQSTILGVLNDNDRETIYKYELPVTNSENSKNLKVPHKHTLSDPSHILGEKLLGKQCDEISIEIPSNGNKRIRQLISPPLPFDITQTLKSAVGIHLSPLGASWARIARDGNKLTNWSFYGFSSLPKKMHLTESFDVAMNIMPRIPPADLYVFESSPTLSPQGQTQTAMVTSHNQLIELNCMLLSLLNTSINYNITLKLNSDSVMSKGVENRVFYLRSKVPARLFRTLVGTERVSAIDMVTGLLENNCSAPTTPVQVDAPIRAAFMSQTPANKELLGQALMLVNSFMDLCVYKNPASLAALAPNRKSNK